MTITELAAEMNQPVDEVERFVASLKVWTDKGYSVCQAIQKHTETMHRLIASTTRLAMGQGCDLDYAFKQYVADSLWSEVNGQ